MRTVIQELIREYMYRLAQANFENSRAFPGPRSPVVARGLGARADRKKKGRADPSHRTKTGPVRGGTAGRNWLDLARPLCSTRVAPGTSERALAGWAVGVPLASGRRRRWSAGQAVASAAG